MKYPKVIATLGASFFVIQILVVLNQNPTAIAYGIPPTNGKLPHASTGITKIIDEAQESLNRIKQMETSALLKLRLTLFGDLRSTKYIETNFHDLKVEKVLFKELRSAAKRLGGNAIGSVEVVQGGFLIITRDGLVYFFDNLKKAINYLGALEEVIGDQSNVIGLRDSLVIEENSSETTMVSSQTYIDIDNKISCFRVKVFLWKITKLSEIKAIKGPNLFETRECVSESLAHAAGIGARLTLLGERNAVLLSLGEMNELHPRNSVYGSIVEISLGQPGQSKIYSRGFRNPSGIVANMSRVYVANQGPRGGDTISLVPRGSDFGWPNQSFGTEYAFSGYPNAKNVEEDNRYNQPDQVFVPSWAFSDLSINRYSRLDFWQNQVGDFDLLATSLKAESLARCRVSPKDQKVIYCEPIYLGERLRSVSSDSSLILILSDGGYIFQIQRR